jgi:hypothetical protein
MSRNTIAGIVIAVLLGAWLRIHGLDIQVVQDDEWHAIHKLMTSSYAEIFRTFGFADHSIPLTMFYKALAATVGLDEITMRAVQVACGIAVIAVCALLAWRATGSASVATLLAFLVAGAPFLVFYSRFARPYAITTLLSVLVLAALWRWRERRTVRLAAAVCVAASLAAWLHPLAALYPMAALLFILLEDLQDSRWRVASARSTIALGLVAGLAIAAPLVVPFLNDAQSLAAKAGDSAPTLYTLGRMLGIFTGGLPDAITVAVAIVAGAGALRFQRVQPRAGAFLMVVTLLPLLAIVLLRGAWSHQGHTLGRYVFPAQLIFLFWFAFGAADLARRVSMGFAPAFEAALVGALIVGYLALTPTITQVTTLGAWYGHLYHHADYVDAHNRAKQHFDRFPVPPFYRRLGALPPGSVTVIHAPFNFVAPYNPDAYYARFHRQRELQGFVHDLCLQGPRYGEVPRDSRFRFRSFVFLDDAAAVTRSGARYLLFQPDQLNGAKFERAGACLDALKRRYGEPVEADGRLVVFDLGRPGGNAKLQ